MIGTKKFVCSNELSERKTTLRTLLGYFIICAETSGGVSEFEINE